MGLLDCVFFGAGAGFKAFFKGFVDACSSAHNGVLALGIEQFCHEFEVHGVAVANVFEDDPFVAA